MVYTPWRPSERLYQPFLRVDDSRNGVVQRVSSLVNERFSGAVSAPSGLADGIARNESRRVGPGGGTTDGWAAAE